MNPASVFAFCLFGVVAGLSWWCCGLLRGRGGERLRERLQGPGEEASTRSAGQDVRAMFHRLGQAAARPFEPKTREKQSSLRRQLAAAGMYSPATARAVTGAKVLLLGGGVIAGYVAGAAVHSTLLGVSLGGLTGYLVPTMWLRLRIKRQRVSLERALPDALDLLVVCVEAGLTVDSAMQRVGEELALAHPALSRELALTHMETRVGLARSEALRNLGQRTGCEALQALAAMLIQAERFGTSIATALRVHGESLRLARQYAAEELAAKASVKLSFPVVLCIFPALLIVLVGPAAIGLMNSALFE